MIDFLSIRHFFFCERWTAYCMRISDWSSDVCSSDLLDQAVAGARFAAAALDVEREAAGLVAARLAFGQPREPIADLGEGAGIGRRVRARGAADRRLIDVDHLVELLEAGDLVVLAGEAAGAVERRRGGGVELGKTSV